MQILRPTNSETRDPPRALDINRINESVFLLLLREPRRSALLAPRDTPIGESVDLEAYF